MPCVQLIRTNNGGYRPKKRNDVVGYLPKNLPRVSNHEILLFKKVVVSIKIVELMIL